MLRLFLPLLLMAFTLTESRSSKRTGRKSVHCELDGRRYALGDTWHPVVPPFGAMPCVNCSCTESGEVNCVSKTCPKPSCPEPKNVANQCCPVCEDYENVPPAVAVEENGNGPDPNLGCDYYGSKYNDGDKFPSNKTALKPTKQGQCVLCVCTKGLVLCHLKSCPAVRCREGYINVSDDCCPTCKDCLGVDGVRLNGTTWTPTVQPFGLMKCVECSCLNGRIECQRKKCPTDKTLPCKRPRKVNGECCKSCRKGDRKDRHNRKSTSPKLATTRTPSSVKPHNGVLKGGLLKPDFFQKLCMPRRTDRLVYKTNTSDSFILAFDVPRKSKVEVLRWTLRRGRVSMSRREQVSSVEFRKRIHIEEIVGATNKSEFKKTLSIAYFENLIRFSSVATNAYPAIIYLAWVLDG